MKKITYTGLVLVLTLAIAAPAFSQAPAAGADGPAYAAIYAATDPAKKAELAEKFMKDFKDTSASYSEPVAKMAVQNYVAVKNWNKVFEVADLFGQVMPKAKPATATYVYTQAMTAAGQANDVAKLMTYGDKVLVVDPNDLNALFTLTTTIVENLPKDEAAKTAAMDKVLAYGQKVVAAPKPAAVPDEAWQTSIQGPVHYALGTVHFTRNKFEEAVKEYELDLKMNPKDAVGQYQLGLAQRGIAMALRPAYVSAFTTFNDAVAAKADKATTDDLDVKATAAEKAFKDQVNVAIEALTKATTMGDTGVAAAAQKVIDQLKQLLA